MDICQNSISFYNIFQMFEICSNPWGSIIKFSQDDGGDYKDFYKSGKKGDLASFDEYWVIGLQSLKTPRLAFC